MSYIKCILLIQLISIWLIHKSSSQQTYIDCTKLCSFSDLQQISANNPIQYVSLPLVFQLTFEVQISGNTNQYPILANILEIWSVSLKKSLVSISLEPMYNSNQITVSYGGQQVIQYGPAITFSDTDFTWLTLTIQETTLIFGNQAYTKSFNIPGGALLSAENIIYASYIEDTSDFSSGGYLRNINIQVITRSPTLSPTLRPTRNPSGPSVKPSKAPTFSPSTDPLCCIEDTYNPPIAVNASMPKQLLCPSATDPSLSKTKSCSTCLSYQCIDWTAGSYLMQARERGFYKATGNLVYFGVGSFGNSSSLAGLCLRATVTGVDRDIIVQIIDKDDSPSVPIQDVYSLVTTASSNLPASERVDLRIQMAGSGLSSSGINACANGGAPSAVPQYYSDLSNWGPISGGWSLPSQCSQLPAYSHCGLQGAAPIPQQDSLPSLCRWSFQQGLKRAPNRASRSFAQYPAITKICAVTCPTELWLATGLHRSDEATTSFTCSAVSTSQQMSAILSAAGALTGKMDCGSPVYSSAAQVQAGGGATAQGFSSVMPCRRDGYVRIDSIPTPPPSARPTESPTYGPTNFPTEEPTPEPTFTVTQSPSPKTRPPTANVTVAPEKIASSQAKQSTNLIENKGVQSAIGFGVFLLMVFALIIFCEWSLKSKAQAEWDRKKEMIRAERRENARNARIALSGSDHYTQLAMAEDLKRSNWGWFSWGSRKPLLEEIEIIA